MVQQFKALWESIGDEPYAGYPTELQADDPMILSSLHYSQITTKREWNKLFVKKSYDSQIVTNDLYTALWGKL